jgi:hypothetical protein
LYDAAVLVECGEVGGLSEAEVIGIQQYVDLFVPVYFYLTVQ